MGPQLNYIDLMWYNKSKYWSYILSDNSSFITDSAKSLLAEREKKLIVALNKIVRKDYNLSDRRPAFSEPITRVVYIHRGVSGVRSISNPIGIYDAADRMGWNLTICCDWKVASFKDAVAAVSDADVVIGPHGAGLSHIYYARPGAYLIELGEYKNVFPWTPIMKRTAESNGGKWIGVNIGKQHYSGPHKGTFSNVSVDLIYEVFNCIENVTCGAMCKTNRIGSRFARDIVFDLPPGVQIP
jgi:hypothetical protein